jgi:hypothetical protein
MQSWPQEGNVRFPWRQGREAKKTMSKKEVEAAYDYGYGSENESYDEGKLF